METIELVSNVLKNVYLAVFQNNLADHRLLNLPETTVRWTYGNEAVVSYYLEENLENAKRKFLRTIALSIDLTEEVKMTNYTQLVDALNLKAQQLLALGLEKQLELFCDSVREDLGVYYSDKVILKAMQNISDEEISEGVKICQLADWSWLGYENGQAVNDFGNKYSATLVKHMIFVFSPNLIEKIRKGCIEETSNETRE